MGKELYFIDLSDLVHPQLIVTLDLKAHSSPQVPALYGDYLCIPACTEFFLVYIGESTRPGGIVSMELPDTTDRLILQDHLLYMNSSQRGLLVINPSDPQNPLKLPGFRLPSVNYLTLGRAPVPGYTLPIGGYSDFIPVPRFGYGAFLPEPWAPSPW